MSIARVIGHVGEKHACGGIAGFKIKVVWGPGYASNFDGDGKFYSGGVLTPSSFVNAPNDGVISVRFNLADLIAHAPSKFGEGSQPYIDNRLVGDSQDPNNFGSNTFNITEYLDDPFWDDKAFPGYDPSDQTWFFPFHDNLDDQLVRFLDTNEDWFISIGLSFWETAVDNEQGGSGANDPYDTVSGFHIYEHKLNTKLDIFPDEKLNSAFDVRLPSRVPYGKYYWQYCLPNNLFQEGYPNHQSTIDFGPEIFDAAVHSGTRYGARINGQDTGYTSQGFEEFLFGEEFLPF